MRLPVLPNDFHPEFSPAFFIMNVQLTKKFTNGMELYGGVKNVFDFVPVNPIFRAFAPFDKTSGDVITNRNGYTFDPNYNYASLQGRRGFAGVRWNVF
jgi:outer membrane receptor for ferrienterochelin and colicins